MLAIASSLTPLSLDFFAPAMPDATRELGTSASAIQATLYLFLIGYALAPFLWGALSDRIGRRRIMLTGLTIYVLAALGCLFAKGVVELSVLRMFQGMGAACGVVVARAVLRDIYGPAGATKAISGMYMIMVWFPISAPILGGYLTSSSSWRFSFLIMALIAIATLVGCLRWQTETRPVVPESHHRSGKGWTSILTNPVFLRYSMTNTFCLTAMLMFLANYSYLIEKDYQLGASESGYVLAIFNANIAVGVYIARLLVPRFGVETSIVIGLCVALGGWLCLTAGSMNTMPVASLLAIALACLGTGIVISLTIGQALVPFTYNAGTASALFICIQSIASALINFTINQLLVSTLIYMSLALAAASLLALLCMLFIGKQRPSHTAGAA